MEVPEKISLIGGSILLASMLVFTLKSQAARLLPQAAAPVQHIDDEASTTPTMVQFNDGYQEAQRNGWQVGKWGDVPYYIDNQHNMYLGSGDLKTDHLRNIIGGDQADRLVSLSIDGHVKAPYTTFLFSTSTDSDYHHSNLTTINGIENVDIANSMVMNIFGSDDSLRNIDLDRLNLSHVKDMYYSFNTTPSLHVTTHWDLNGKNLFGTFSDSGVHNEQP